MALVGVTVAAVAGFARGLPDPGLMANLDNTCAQFSQDGGTIWGDASAITLDASFVPAPGGEYLQGDFLVRNICDAPASLQVYAGRWGVSAGAAGTWRTDLAGSAGTPVTLTGPATEAGRGVLIGKTAAPRNRVIPVRLYLGIPAGETAQSYSITPGWAFSLEQSEPPEAPAPPTVSRVDPQAPTTEDTVTVSGTAEPGSVVDVTVDGLVRCSTTATTTGTFTCDVGRVPRGTHILSATATNSAGPSEAARGLSLTVRSAHSGWGSLGDLLGWGSLAGLVGFGSLGSLGSAGGLDSLGSDGPGSGGSPGSHGGVDGSGRQPHRGGSAGSGGGSQAGPPAGPGSSGSSMTSSARAASRSTSNRAAESSVGRQASGGASTGRIPGASLGIGPAAPGGEGRDERPERADGEVPAGSTYPGSVAGSAGSSSMDHLIHLGGPIIRVVPG